MDGEGKEKDQKGNVQKLKHKCAVQRCDVGEKSRLRLETIGVQVVRPRLVYDKTRRSAVSFSSLYVSGVVCRVKVVLLALFRFLFFFPSLVF